MKEKRLTTQVRNTLASTDFKKNLESLFSFLSNSKMPETSRNFISQLSSLINQVETSYVESETLLATAERRQETFARELTRANDSLQHSKRLTQNILKGLWEGFLILDRQGCCTNYVSKQAEVLLEFNPAGMSLGQILKTPAHELADLNEWYDYLFTFSAPFDEIASLGPSVFKHSAQDKFIALQFKPIYDLSGTLDSIVMILNDTSEQMEAKRNAEKLSAVSEMILQRYQNAPAFARCLELLHKCILHFTLSRDAKNPSTLVKDLRRELHTLKGVLGIFSLTDLNRAIHQIESNLAAAERNQEIDGEFLSLQGILLNEAYQSFFASYRETLGLEKDTSQGARIIHYSKIEGFQKTLKDSGADRQVIELFHSVFCKVKLCDFLRPLRMLALNQAGRLGKSLRVEIDCPEDLSVDPTSIESFLDHLTHVINNAVDHGIENRDEREWAGKPLDGLIEIKANIVGRELFVSVRDDGRGLDLESIRKAAPPEDVSKPLSDSEVQNSIFAHGFTTRSSVGPVSGRGIGLDALKEWVKRNSGSIQVKSHPGQGCVFEFRIPLTLEDPLLSAG